MNTFLHHHQSSIRFAYECFDRILLNAVIQVLQSPASVVGFLREKRQLTEVTPACLKAISADYHGIISGGGVERGHSRRRRPKLSASVHYAVQRS